MLKIPYGISNFETLIREKHLFFDKTPYIEILEKDMKFQFFIRPRRFGKSLFISMLENYYDIKRKDKFDELFGNLYIGKNPTPQRNSFLVLRLSFAGIVTNLGKDELIKSFSQTVTFAVDSFLRLYKDILTRDSLPENIISGDGALKFIVEECNLCSQKIFLIIDEYDNFANDLIAENNKDMYYDLLTGEGYIRSFYKTIKEGTTSSIDRIFMTGVSPIMLDDLTSGFNITQNITLKEEYNEMLGVTQDELEKVLDDVAKDFEFDKDQVLKDLRFYYNGYKFSEFAKTRVYNTDMIIYFLMDFASKGSYPREILDNNVKTDYKKLRQLAFKFKDEERVSQLLDNETISGQIVDRFSLDRMFADKNNFISLLMYMGMLTIQDEDMGEITFAIPNYVSKKVYWEYFLDYVRDEFDFDTSILAPAMRKMMKDGDCSSFIAYMKTILESLSNRDLAKFDEKYIKVLIMTLVSVNGVYIADSEYETAGGYVDIVLFKDQRYAQRLKYEWLIELKYVKESDRKKVDKIRKDGIEQLKKYGMSKKICGRFLGTEIKQVVITVVGKNDIYVDEV